MANNKRVMPDPNEPGVKDATVSDFLLPYLMGEIPAVKGAMSMLPSAPMIGKMAPAAEDAAGSEMRDAMMRSMGRPAMAKGGMVKDDDEAEMMPHLAEGDFSLGDDFNVDTGDSSTVKAMPLSPTAVPPAAPQINVTPKTPVTPMPAPPPVAAAPKPMPGMPPDVTPDDIQKYLGAQKQAIQKYSPDQEYAQEEAMLKARTGLPMGLAHAGATFADALMQGVAGKGNPGFAKQIDERNAEVAAAQTGAMERARKGTMEQVEAEQKVDMNDPVSPISKIHQQAYAPIFVKMGYDPKLVAKMPASQINTVADLGVRYEDADTQLQLKKAMLQVQTLTAMANMANQQAERKQKETETQKGAAEETSKHYIAHPIDAWKAHQTLADIAQGKPTVAAPASYTPDVISYAQTHKITPEQAQAIKDKRTGGQ